MQEVGNVQSGDSARIQSAASREQSGNDQIRHGSGGANARVPVRAKVTSSPDITRTQKPEFTEEDVLADSSSEKLKDTLPTSLVDWLSDRGKFDSGAPKMPVVSEGKSENGAGLESVAARTADRMASEIASNRPMSLQVQANVAQGAALHLLTMETPAEATQESDQKQYTLSDVSDGQGASNVDPVRARKTEFAEQGVPADPSSEKLKDARLSSFVDWFSEHSKVISSAPEMSIVSEDELAMGASREIVAAKTVGRMASEIASNRPTSLQVQANVAQGAALHLLTMGELAEATQEPDQKQHTLSDASDGQDASNVGPMSARKPEFAEEDLPADSSSEKLKDALLSSFVDWFSEHSKMGSSASEMLIASEGKLATGASREAVAAQTAGDMASEITSDSHTSLLIQANVTQDAALHLLAVGALAETIQEPGQKPHTLFDADYTDVRTKVAKMPHEPM